jgi:sterol desaturase/sphingolipid hydroxylase (fatty acid hydroxylase superfamily)
MADILTLLVLASFFGLVLFDSLRPARAFRQVAWWRTRGIASFVINLVVSTALPLFWDGWLGQFRLIDATSLGLVGGSVVAVLAIEFGVYWWHRALHRSPFLWRWFHQVHHSAERIDTAGAFYFSPLDMVGFTFVTSFSLVVMVGVTAEAALVGIVFSTLVAMFGHANLRTPAWLGYFVHRPENHALHHERGVHGFNYGGLAIMDQLFGTWRNPATWEAQAGFFEGSTDRLGDMLLGRDIAAEVEAPVEHPQYAGEPVLR